MAETPKNDIEKLLSDYAEQRRNAAGTPQLHPATRRILQSEVRREFPSSQQADTPPSTSKWSILWPRLAWVCGIVVVAATVVVMNNPSREGSTSMEMARTEKDESASAPAATTLTVPVAPPEDTARRESTAPVATKGGVGFVVSEAPANSPKDVASASGVIGEERNAPATLAVAAADVEQPGAADSASSMARMGGRAAGGRGGGMRGGMGGGRVSLPEAADASGSQPLLATAPPPAVMTKAAGEGSPAAASAQMSKSADNIPNIQAAQILNNSLTQRYRNVVLVERQTAVATPPVLDEFIVEQNGNEMKIVDRDGSVYYGTISNLVSESVVAMDNVATPYAAPAQAAAAGPAESAMTFQAGGAPQRAQQFGGGGRGGGGGGFGGATLQAQQFNEQQNFHFRVEGTNRSLRQSVVFTGNMIQNTFANSSQYNLSNGANTQQFRQQPQVQQVTGMNTVNLQMQNMQLRNNFINGRVTLDDGRVSTEINALQVEP